MAEPIAEHLNRLSALRAQVETLAEEKEAARRRLIPPEIQAQLDTLDQEFAETGKDLNEQIAVTEGTIKQLVLTQGASAAGSHLQAIFMGGRVSWDNKALSVYATMHPEIKQYRKEGEPYVVSKARGFRAPAF